MLSPLLCMPFFGLLVPSVKWCGDLGIWLACKYEFWRVDRYNIRNEWKPLLRRDKHCFKAPLIDVGGTVDNIKKGNIKMRQGTIQGFAGGTSITF